MVHIVEGSPLCRGYRETNRQLAKENGEIKQILGDIIKENAERREEIHRCHVRIIELEIIEKKYNALKQKYNSIVKIIEGPEEETLSITARSNEQQSIVLALQHASDIEEQETQLTNPYRLDAISEHDDEEEGELEEDKGLTRTLSEHQMTTTTTNSPKNDASKPHSLYDSLEPADVTSMPCLDEKSPAPEQATLSIWKCLDDTHTPNTDQLKDVDMFSSTPKKPKSAHTESQSNLSPMGEDSELQNKVTLVQHQQQLANADSRLNISPLISNQEPLKRVTFVKQQTPQKQMQEAEVEMEEKGKGVKKIKRKTKQKEEDAKRPRYNLRKRN